MRRFLSGAVPFYALAAEAGQPPRQPARPANGTPSNGAAASPMPEGGGTLAERIRALQAHASRARQQGA